MKHQSLPLSLLLMLFTAEVKPLGDMWQFERLQVRLLAGAQVITDGRF